MNAVADHKRGAADVVRDDAQRNIALFIRAVFDARDPRDVLHDVLHGVDEEQIVHALHHAGQALEAHAGVDVLLVERRVVAVAVVVKLGENEVPDLDEAVAVAADACRSVCRSRIFRRGQNRFREQGPQGPEPCSQKLSSLPSRTICVGSTPILLGPDLEGLVVVKIDET
jgi:hypothetical protein